MGLSTLSTLRKAKDVGIRTSFINESRNLEFLGKPLPLSVFGGSEWRSNRLNQKLYLIIAAPTGFEPGPND
jgi:hypothetical protein